MPYLTGKSGKFKLLQKEYVIGRSSECEIVLNNSYVSRKHARIYREKSNWFIEDLGSRFGTFVNGNKIEKPVKIQNNDVLTFGPIEFSFIEQEIDESTYNIQKLKDTIQILKSKVPEYTSQLKKIEELLTSYERMQTQSAMYAFLLELTGKINTFNSEELLEFILKNAVNLTGAERGVIVRVTQNSTLIPVFTYGSMEETDNLPSSIMKKVMETKKPVIIENALEDPNWGMHTSVFSMKIRSVLAFPIISGNEPIGVAYFENRTIEGIFNSTHLKLAEQLSKHISMILTTFTRTESRRQRLKRLRESFDFSDLIGESEAFIEVLELIAKVAPTDTPVILSGESGTGKELVARAIHKNSTRRKGPFVIINCATIPKDLFEAELFGYVKGAFSGAYRDKAGKVEMADGGTLFLDELAELPQDTQAKLLRLLQFKEIEPLGSTKTKKLDIRIIAATSRNLKELIKEGKFREDLYYRLNVFQIYLPPLRERKEDIPLLAKHFIKKYGKGKSISQKALHTLLEYDFPGNIRELENIIQRAVVFAGDLDNILPEHLPKELFTSDSLDYKDPKTIQKVLENTGMNVKKAAQILGISRRHLYRLMDKFNIKKH